MKRKIKFRAWDEKHNCWDDDFAINADGCLYQPAKARWNISDIAIETAYDELEVMQYTGLKDKNGKEIYEGDIVKTDVRAGNMRVIYFDSYASFMLEHKGLLYPLNDGADIEVIGNIYEHKYLF